MKLGTALASALGLGVMISGGSSIYLFKKVIEREINLEKHRATIIAGTNWEKYMPTIHKEKLWLMGKKPEEVTLTAFDGLKLKGRWLHGKENGKGLILCFHGYKSAGMSDFAALAHFYYRLGYEVLMVDHRAHGESEGTYIGFGCLEQRDCRDWIDYVIERMGNACHIYLHGISMGGATVMMTSGMPLPTAIKGIISDCGFTSAWDVFKHRLKKDYHLPTFPILYLASMICKAKAGYYFEDYSSLDAVKEAKVPMLFIHGAEDDFVPTWMSKKIYEACMAEKKLLIIEGAGHGESYYAHTAVYEREVAAFLSQCEEV